MPDPLLLQALVPTRRACSPALEREKDEPRDFVVDFDVAARVGRFYGGRVWREGTYVFYEFTRRDGGRYVARLSCENYPWLAPKLAFLDPATGAPSSDRRHWPPSGPVGNHRGNVSICMPGIVTNPGDQRDRALPRILEMLALCCYGKATIPRPRMR